MRFFNFSPDEENLTLSYDGKDYHVWGSKNGAMLGIRKKVRAHLFEKQKYKCAYCQMEKKETHGLVWDIDHILPKSVYPQFIFEPENLALSCKDCNIAKGEQEVLFTPKKKLKHLPDKKEHYKIIHPNLDNYSDHIEINIINGKKLYRVKNETKGKQTYIMCNLFRFDCRYGEWDNFNDALVASVSEYLDRFPKDYTLEDIKKVLPGFKTT